MLILLELIKKAELLLKERGYKEVHNTAPVGKEEAIQIRLKAGFTKGKDYTWFWKKL